jgi:hypothetical protein
MLTQPFIKKLLPFAVSAEEFVNIKFQIPDVKTTLEGIASLMENDIEKKVEVSSLLFHTGLTLRPFSFSSL